ncbi:MAG: response regulator transcription factor [Eubacterium sp.]|nr:response regulator transcription factor [Eubacterium sp.]
MLIYIVEDEENIRELETYALIKNGYDVLSFDNSTDFYDAIKKQIPDLILLDVMLPGDDGLTILEKLRSNTAFSRIPIIIVSAKTTELDRVRGLDLGADDYICKPFSVMEMLSRVKARLRNIQHDKSTTTVFGDIEMSEDTRTVTVKNIPVELTYKEYELLKLFLINPRIVLQRDTILNKIWGHDSTGRTLDVHIRSLRAKLGESGKYIKTVRSVGYKLDKDV